MLQRWEIRNPLHVSRYTPSVEKIPKVRSILRRPGGSALPANTFALHGGKTGGSFGRENGACRRNNVATDLHNKFLPINNLYTRCCMCENHLIPHRRRLHPSLDPSQRPVPCEKAQCSVPAPRASPSQTSSWDLDSPLAPYPSLGHPAPYS